MNNIKKMMSHFIVLGLIAGTGFSAALFNSRGEAPTRVVAEEEAAEKEWTAEDFKDEVEVDPNLLSVGISQSNVTETSQSLTFSFRSKTSKGFNNGRDTFTIQIEDDNYTENIDAPVANPDDYERMEYENPEDANDPTKKKLPVFNGTIVFITSNTSKDVYLPAKMTYAEKFIINVTGIAKNAICKNGAKEKDYKNTWGSIKNVIIPNTIIHADEGAFSDTPAATKFYYEGDELPVGFEDGWCGVADENIIVQEDCYDKESSKAIRIAGDITIQDDYGRPVSFILGCKNGEGFEGEQFNRPLVIQYDLVTTEDDGTEKRETKYEALPLINTNNNLWDGCGIIAQLTYSRLLTYRLDSNQTIDDDTIYFHNLMKSTNQLEIDTNQVYKAKAKITYSHKQDIHNIINYKSTSVKTFAGYTMFSMTVDKALVTTKDNPEPHSIYMDVKADMYEQNISRIKTGQTKIRYSFQNFYNSFYYIKYKVGKNQYKEITLPIKTVIPYQILEKDKGNQVSILLKNSEIGSDFSADKIVLFEIKDLSIQLDLTTKTSSGTTSILSKTQVNYKFAYVAVTEVREGKSANVFNWNIFLIIFFIAYAVIYTILAYVTYRVMKEKFKNDEFRRVKGKEFLKKAIIGGAGFGVIIAAILFIVMRFFGFSNSIVVFNPTDPFVIIFAIAGLIIFGYFVVYGIKLVKAEQERRKAIRLKLNEDVDDDGTN